MEEEKQESAAQATEEQQEASNKASSSAEEQRWLTVYTDYGYGQVDANKFLAQTEECVREQALAQQPILEYIQQKHSQLTKEAEEAAMKEAQEREEQEKKAAEEAQLKQEEDAKLSENAASAEAEAAEKESQDKKEAEKEKEGDQANEKQKDGKELPEKKPIETQVTDKLLQQIQLTQEQKESVRQIYNKISTVKFRWGGIGYIQRRLISTTITVNVKTLHGQRKTHTFQVSIFDKVEKIREKLCEVEPEEMKDYPVPRFIYPVGRIRQLNMDDVIEKIELKSNCTLVLMGLKSFSWDAEKCDKNINLENKAMKAVRASNGDHNHRTVLATQGFSQGRRYWEVVVDNFQNNTAIFIGVCKAQELVTLGEMQETYGILIPECKKFVRRPEASQYSMEKFGQSIKKGDTIGLLLEFVDGGQAELTFFKNGGLIGKAFTEMKEGEYFPCLSINYGSNTVTLNSSGKMPQEPYRNLDESGSGNEQQNQMLEDSEE